MRSAASTIAPAAPSASTIAAAFCKCFKDNPFQGSDYTRRVKGVAGLLVGLGAAALVLGDRFVYPAGSRAAAASTRCRRSSSRPTTGG